MLDIEIDKLTISMEYAFMEDRFLNSVPIVLKSMT